jgi:uncharacterized protein
MSVILSLLYHNRVEGIVFMEFIVRIFVESWNILLDSSVYILIGIVIAGFLQVVLNGNFILNHLGKGRYSSVVKAAFLGVPLPLCSCGVLPAAASLKKQGANKGATSAFLISTPESGVDSIAITYALLDPLMTLIRPLAAFISAMAAGFLENFLHWPQGSEFSPKNLSCTVDQCCDGVDCPPEVHAKHHGLWEKCIAGLKFSIRDVWGDIVLWFFAGLLLAGCITALVPDQLLGEWLGGGVASMFIMLLVGIPMYICATASTPIAAALILKGVSPGAALVFLLVGPATNITSLSVLISILGKKSTIRYLIVLSVSAVFFGLGVDAVYSMMNVSPQAVIGEASGLFSHNVKLVATFILLAISIKPIGIWLRKLLKPKKKETQYFSDFPTLPGNTK